MTRCARCDWLPDLTEGPPREQLRQHALDAGHPLCACCARSLRDVDGAIACESCLTLAREHLAGIVVMEQELSEHLGHASGVSVGRGGGDEHALPGGTVLSLIGPGGTGTLPSRRGNTEHLADNLPCDPSSVAWTLASWEDDWRHTRGEPAAIVDGGRGGLRATLRAASHYLEVNARWAANMHPAFAEFADELRALHVRLEQATGRTRTPTRAAARCFDCQSDLVRRVVDGLEEDHVTCAGCRQQYNAARYTLALRAELERVSRFDVAGEAFATPAIVAGLLNRSERTVRAWLRAGLVRRQDRNGVAFVSVGDAARESVARPRRVVA